MKNIHPSEPLSMARSADEFLIRSLASLVIYTAMVVKLRLTGLGPFFDNTLVSVPNYPSISELPGNEFLIARAPNLEYSDMPSTSSTDLTIFPTTYFRITRL